MNADEANVVTLNVGTRTHFVTTFVELYCSTVQHDPHVVWGQPIGFDHENIGSTQDEPVGFGFHYNETLEGYHLKVRDLVLNKASVNYRGQMKDLDVNAAVAKVGYYGHQVKMKAMTNSVLVKVQERIGVSHEGMMMLGTMAQDQGDEIVKTIS